MRYLLNQKTQKTVEVADDDDKKFYALLAERDADNRQLYVQTGAHDPAVDDKVVVPGQERGPSTMERAGLTGDPGEPSPGASTLRERQATAAATGEKAKDDAKAALAKAK